MVYIEGATFSHNESRDPIIIRVHFIKRNSPEVQQKLF